MANIITVSALNKYVRSLLESDPVLTDIAIRGEISNFKKHYKTGHCYFSLKDNNAAVKAVMFRSDAERLVFRPEDGIQVVARCRISLYERDGAFQLYVQDLFPDGVGAAQLAFEQLKQKLAQEGLFNPEYKKPLPPYPGRIGVVTSKTGAALQDILKVADRRCPGAEFVLAPVTVQGLAAADEIAAAIRRLDESRLVDVILVARGGGSAEDLWVFNAESIARAVFASETPVVSAIGHETDVSILDFVADLRAPTPSAAAEMILPDLWQARAAMGIIYKNIANNIHYRWQAWYNRIQDCRIHPGMAAARALPGRKSRELGALSAALRKEAGRTTDLAQLRLRAAASVAAGANPYALLAKGYSVARSRGSVVRSVAQVQPGAELELTVYDGILNCRVDSVSAAETADGGK